MYNKVVDLSLSYWLGASVLLTIIPLYSDVLLWLYALYFVLWYRHCKQFKKQDAQPERISRAKKWKVVIVVLCVIAFVLSINKGFSLQNFVSLLVLTTCLKLMELESNRDYYLLIFLGCIISACQLLLNNGLLAFAYALVCFFALHLCLLKVTSSSHTFKKQQLKKQSGLLFSLASAGGAKNVLVIFLQALPVAVVLFIVVPKVGGLWKVPLNKQVAKTGISDELSIGDISQLNQDHSIAMRVTFNEEKREKAELSALYWRGLTLNYFDGKTWRRQQYNRNTPLLSFDKAKNLKALAQQTDNILSYSIMLERSGRPWLYSLQTPLATNSDIIQRSDYTLAQRSSILERYQYNVSSYPDYQDSSALTKEEFALYTQLPDSGNLASREFSAKLWAQNPTTDEFVDALMGYFNREFTYTLSPQTSVAGEAIDDFLFDTQLGYCEHFASSTTFLLRAAKIPARIATGYQGGQWSENQDYLMVTQADAHAWVEVWREGQGWTRLDPTAAVAPQRVEQGAASFLRELNKDSNFVSQLNNSGVLQAFRKRWDSVNYQWHRWVLGYDNTMQLALVKKLLGGIEPWRIAGFILLPIILLLSPLLLKNLLQQYRCRYLDPVNPVFKSLAKLDKKLARLGIHRAKGETLTEFVSRAKLQSPHHQQKLTTINDIFNRSLYQKVALDDGQTKELLSLIKQLN
jgi:transglutaminase-like putative cysteine protease